MVRISAAKELRDATERLARENGLDRIAIEQLKEAAKGLGYGRAAA
jgi:hypothetical protein